MRKQVSDGDLENIGEGILLTKDGRTKIIKSVMKALSEKAKFNRKKLSISQIILEQSREIVRFILVQSETLEVFILEN